ncbi:hypothetical protein MKW92_000748 [Papaver armeniacum]|nr:hypothetical protein MKW92_000748 [Papaver armeniacum]
MKSFRLLFIHHYFLFCLLIGMAHFPLACHGCHEQDRRALIDFKSSLEDPANRLTSWQDSFQHQNCCSWHGVVCSYDSFRVISISLRNTAYENVGKAAELQQFDFHYSVNYSPPNTSLAGKFSPSLFNITHLEYIDLAWNNFQGTPIPLQLSHLTKLSHLDLSHSYIGSSISTQFNNLSSLNRLDLSGNYYLQSSSLKWVRGLVNLQVLKLSGIDLYEATFSVENFGEHTSHLSNLKQLTNLTSLSSLYLSNCGLLGSVTYLPQLKELDLSYNSNLNPDLTRMFQHQWPKLQKLTISSTNMSGSIPSSISNAPLLVSLSASRCLIQGSLPSSIYNITQLQSLDLSVNNITGYIHPSISNLKFLTILDLSYNKFQGSIPKSISNLKFLNILNLSFNKIGGPIPSSIGKILSLQQLSLQSNNITGSIPSCISNLHNLTEFSVNNNSIGGNVSLISLINDLSLTSIDLLPNRLTVVIDQNFHLYSKFQLEYLVLPSCNLTGLFPTFICELSNLKSLDLSHNHMTGVIPSCITKLKNLNNFDISNNQFSGPLPLPLQSSFDLSNNKFSGEISIETGKTISSFRVINLAGNELSGSIPSSICSKDSRSSLRIIDLSNNNFSGVIPNTLGYCRDLESVNLGGNNLTGNVPNEIEQLELLGYLQLQDNYLNGTPLSFISKLHGLVVLNLANNHFEGSIPIALFGPQYSPLSIISLRSNKFNGSIPDEINNLNQLQILDLSHNKLSGHIPKQLGGYWMSLTGNSEMLREEYDIQLKMVINGIMLQYQKVYIYDSGLDLSCNMFDGNIPTEIGRLKGLRRLNLSHNHLSDDIPASIGDMSNLVSLDLSFNSLSGKIPQSLTSLDFLGILNLSYNELSGKIPEGIHFGTLGGDGWAFVGNALLCGEPTKKVCEVEEDDRENDQEDASEKLILYSVIFVGFGVGFWGLFFVMLINREKWWFPYWRFIDLVVAVIIRCIQNK